MKPDFKSADDLIPAIIQDVDTKVVLMLGYMNQEAWEQTLKTKQVTFFSRSKNRLWVKGETSGNFLNFVEAKLDCDQDSILISAKPVGPACHTGQDTCFNEINNFGPQFFFYLEDLINQRKLATAKSSYTKKLMDQGIPAIAQKVGEEAVESVIEAVIGNKPKFLEESADLLFHLLVLTAKQDLKFADIVQVLKARHQAD